MRVSTSRAILASLSILFAGSGSALAEDAQTFGNRVKEVASQTTVQISFASAEAQGENVVLKSVSLWAGGKTADIGDVTFEGVTGSDADGWKVARVPIADIDKFDEISRTQVKGMVVSGIQIAPKEKLSALPGGALWFFDSAAVESVKGSDRGKPVFDLGVTSYVNSVASDGVVNGNFTLGDITADFSANPEDSVAKTMIAVGYTRMTGNGIAHMNWDPKTGDLKLDPFTLDLKDAGKLDLAYFVKGYTPAFVKQLNQILHQMAAKPDQASQSGMAIFGLLFQLSIGSFDIRFTDASLTNKLLDYYAKQNGTTRELLADRLRQMAPGMLASLNNPTFQAQVSSAVSTFLKDPKSLNIAVKPTQPIPAIQILGAIGAPQTLPEVLQLKVTANR